MIDGRTMYLAGGFHQLGEATGSLVIVDALAGEPIPPHAHVEGAIEAIVNDGAGGWFIAGDLRKVGPLEQASLAHIGADGELIELPVTLGGGEAISVARMNNTLIIVGDFEMVNDEMRSGLAPIDAVTGATLPWDPAPDRRPIDMKVVGDTLYLVGGFTTMAGEARSSVASFRGPDLELTPWAPEVLEGVETIDIAASVALLGGRFALPGEFGRTQVAAVDLVTGAPTGWRVDGFGTDGTISEILASSSSLYIAGEFERVEGLDRTSLAAADTTTGEVLPFAPEIWYDTTADPEVRSLAMTDQGLVFGGEFIEVNGAARRSVAMVDPLTGDTLTWDPKVDEDPGVYGGLNAVASAGPGAVATAGEFAITGGEYRNQVAAIDLETGELLPWTVDLQKRERDREFAITGMIVAEDHVYLSGTFEKADGFTVNGLAAFSR